MTAENRLLGWLRRMLPSRTALRCSREMRAAWPAPAAEILECRNLLSVVTATFSAGSLTLTGDAGKHDLTFARNNATGLVRVQGFNETQIAFNGQTRSFQEFALTANLTIEMGGGDDYVGIDGRGFPLSGALIARFGGGRNNFTAGDLTANAGVQFTGGDFVDNVSFAFLTTSHVQISTGGTFDGVTFWSSKISGAVVLSTGAGSDSIYIENSELAGPFQLDTGSGGENDNVILIGDTLKGPALISTGGGSDHIGILNDNLQGGMQLLAGDGDNTVEFQNSRISSLLVVLTGSGRDTVELGTDDPMTTIHGPVTTDGPVTIDTGSGDDQIVIARSRFNSSVYLSTGYDKASNSISIDDSTFNGGFTALTFGVNNSINIERNSAYAGQTSFNGPVTMAMYGGSSRINIGDSSVPSNKTRFGSSVLIVGGNPRTTVRYALSSTTFVIPPTLINSTLVT